jgi:superfamily II DNA or RNA helicase
MAFPLIPTRRSLIQTDLAVADFRPYQTDAATELSCILSARNFALDASDTGIGKTFTAIATALEFENADGERPPVAVICRARAVTKWTDALAAFNVDPVFVMSWERARGGRNEFFLPIRNRRGRVTTFNLRLPSPMILVIDELHAGGGLKSLNAELVIAARRCPEAMVLGLSATPADSPLKMRALGFCVELHQLDDNFWNWCRRNGCVKSPFGGLYFRKGDRERVLGSIHRHLFEGPAKWGIRLRKKDLFEAGQFPEAQTSVELWDISESTPSWLEPWLEQVNEDEQADVERHDGNPSPGIIAIRDRQRGELLKVPALIEEIEERIEEGESVIVFVQFTRTIQTISERLDKIDHKILDGKRSRRDQDAAVNDFQSGLVRLLVCQVDAGSESIDLHDVHGNRPRHVIIFPTYKAVTLIQVLGRAVRSGAKSPVVQRIVYSSTGIESKIARAVENRLENLSLLTDGELNMEGMI